MTQRHNFKCPKCGSTETIEIQVSSWAHITDEGSDTDISTDGSQEFNNESLAHCKNSFCGFFGRAGEFLPTPETPYWEDK